MGVPAFFRWLQRKYPTIVVSCIEEKPKEGEDGEKIPVDCSQPNPNDYEFDNLYLDMNGIIHPCSHPENKPAPKNEAEMMTNIFEYIDRIFSICRPRRLLYMAIDGVAPRAKMNQQRSRRFRAAKEGRESRAIVADIKAKLREKGAKLPPEEEKKEGEHFDSNCITPGTEFMDRLSVCLRYYISDRLTNDPGWKNIKVILSDANVPGEGEHKIMDYIRKQRAQPDHDPNTKHCLNGADADLIMLGLATHEAHFTIIREEFKPNQPKPCEVCGQAGHEKEECEGLPVVEGEEYGDAPAPFVGADVEFIFIRLHVLREYLERDLKMEGIPFGYQFDRALDDWVFMCFFVGNDFLPHLPSLEIREGGIDKLVGIYKQCLPKMGGYLAENGYCNLKRVQLILIELGKLEDQIFKDRQQFELRMKRRREQQADREAREAAKRVRLGADGNDWAPRNFSSPLGGRGGGRGGGPPNLMSMLTPNPDGSQGSPWTPQSGGNKRTASQANLSPSPQVKPKVEVEPEDNIKLYEAGWKDRYYLYKFGVSHESDPEYFDSFSSQVASEYVLGLAWVLLYYYQGCPSWKWFYPFHYAPFASDFHNIDKVDTSFEKDTVPFRPLEQLMSVFPSASGKFLPPTWREKMSSPDSEIIDFYPVDFKIDLNGKRYAWQGVALLPFVDEMRLHRTLADVYDDLSEDEKRRNRRDEAVLFISKGNDMFNFVNELLNERMLRQKQDIVTDFSNGMRGQIFLDNMAVLPGNIYPAPIPRVPDLTDITCISVRYNDPIYEKDYVYPCVALKNAVPPERTLKPENYPKDTPYRPKLGMSNHSHNPYTPSPGAHRMLQYNLGSQNSSNQRSPSSSRGSPQSFRDSPGSHRGSPRSYNSSPNSHRGSPNSFRDSPNSFRGSPHSNRDSPSSYYNRGNPSPHNQSFPSYKPRGGNHSTPLAQYLNNSNPSRGNSNNNNYRRQSDQNYQRYNRR